MFFSRRAKADEAKTVEAKSIRRLLVVEDDALVAFAHEHDLTSAGYEVVATVNCGETAVAALAEQMIDAIVLDLDIQGDISGADVARLAHHRGMPVLLVSGHPPGDTADFIAAYLAKPHASGAVVAALRAIEAHHYRSEPPRRVAGLTLFPGRSPTANG